jgi:enoyl-CoA hydratase
LSFRASGLPWRLNVSIAEGLAIESEQFARMVPTRDNREARNAWIARRRPNYTGC